MTTELICAGFGGQGVLTIGKFIAKAGMKEGKNVSWLPSYGPEMRGGTANVSTVVSDEEIASPIVSFPDVLVALNQPSIDKFAPSIRPGGILILNTNMCPHGCKRDDIVQIAAPLVDIAKEIGDPMVLNMLAIGVLIGKTGLIKYETMEEDLTSYMKSRNPELLKLNLEAIKRGIDIAKNAK
ncbi:MAG: 2-oxoacid:acceptor oxidoreductase family protein [Candidatus Cloacimonadaceae bacterium]|jgi:2-oxoglutarate ferredoxin oxidoreductase subunit gamma|nr:2-oxoacid:acceptor oxidoreductase family protein [Candidatus Cloacimonadota bacterium]MDY0126648.1 2-oxoacid:acceptor oxidoreductase family protein [Candidatus Cloacimonadaceae bacterium]MCB5255261.1 2-oxoacid:acceptor oxidoreductase family protein [Candidatus Cloacimonadota bacterium]MCK9177483.1 2-oxoacid:acceptor oxidoreductase family protein [Candidatus Cloacimonadota bacterium]MCK9242747.1 2-oxoacid:acceptor oxidoreductase family protein [Candidatus Cloacimonadota bacterium]